MKAMIFVMMVSLFVATGCSSKKKEVETTVTNEVEQVETAVEEKVEEVKEEMTETVEEVKSTMEVSSNFTCTAGADERSVEIVKGESPKCEVFYTKSGEKLSIARANWDVSYCEKVAGQVRGNLENAGFSCN